MTTTEPGAREVTIIATPYQLRGDVWVAQCPTCGACSYMAASFHTMPTTFIHYHAA